MFALPCGLDVAFCQDVSDKTPINIHAHVLAHLYECALF